MINKQTWMSKDLRMISHKNHHVIKASIPISSLNLNHLSRPSNNTRSTQVSIKNHIMSATLNTQVSKSILLSRKVQILRLITCHIITISWETCSQNLQIRSSSKEPLTSFSMWWSRGNFTKKNQNPTLLLSTTRDKPAIKATMFKDMNKSQSSLVLTFHVIHLRNPNLTISFHKKIRNLLNLIKIPKCKLLKYGKISKQLSQFLIRSWQLVKVMTYCPWRMLIKVLLLQMTSMRDLWRTILEIKIMI